MTTFRRAFLTLTLLCVCSCTTTIEPQRSIGTITGRVRFESPRGMPVTVVRIEANNGAYVTHPDSLGWWWLSAPEGVLKFHFTAPDTPPLDFSYQCIGVDTMPLGITILEQAARGHIELDTLYRLPAHDTIHFAQQFARVRATSFEDTMKNNEIRVALSIDSLDLVNPSWNTIMYSVDHDSIVPIPRDYNGHRMKYWRAILWSNGHPCFDTTKGPEYDVGTFAATPILRIEE